VAAALRGLPLVERLGATVDLAEVRLDPVVEETLYAVVSEGLSNVAKYAGPCQVNVSFTVTDGSATVLVSDDGPGGAEVGAGSGLPGLADRVESLGGWLTVSSQPERGTEVRASMPVSVPVSEKGDERRLPSAAGTPAAS
jgi:signal transduction histidine kinase